ncbi:MAG: 50S ribosomal protein L6 [Nanoarchaeota archaeon]|nr:50S ribosomal protein L6 [Nanoarchaeota archaeon]MBU4123942.1 50S ribosomal protein L6 [Nanoarchaeota archaeon]
MEKTFQIPEGVNVEINNFEITVTGKKGKLEKNFANPVFTNKIKIVKTDKEVKVSTDSDKRKIKAMIGTIVAYLKNMSVGVTDGYKYTMKIVYMHFPFTVKLDGKVIIIGNFLGGKALRKSKIIGDTNVEIKGDDVIVTGVNVEEVGQTCANLETATKIKDRDRRVFQDGIFLSSRG